MGDWDPYELSDFEYAVLKLYLDYGYGEEWLFDTPFFSSHFTRENVQMTLRQFANEVNKRRRKELHG